MSENVHEISDSTFEAEVLGSEIPVLVDFWAPWCGPCKAIAPILEEVAVQFSGRLKIVKVNVTDNTAYAETYNVSSIPNLLFVKGGKVVDRLVGYATKDQLVEAIEKVL